MSHNETISLQKALPDLLITQLMAAEVYVTFIKYSRNKELAVWHRMLASELSSIRFLSMLMEEKELPSLALPCVRLQTFCSLCERAREFAPQSAFERTLWALRLEHAEIDFGLEALSTNVVGHAPDTPVYPGSVETEYAHLLEWALRYKGAREIAIQIARIEEHMPRANDTGAYQDL